MKGIRVIAGTARGRKLRAVPGEGVRPIGDRVKEALFNIIGADIGQSSVLDLFAGTGSVGIEALSRGAQRVIFVDNNRRAIQTIQQNLRHTGLEERATVIQSDAFLFLEQRNEPPMDYIYIAPPQYKQLWSRAVHLADDRQDWLNPDAWVIAQVHPHEYKCLTLTRLEEFDQRRYGSTMLVFYTLPGD